jgi:laminin alpha 1/2
MFDGRDCSLCIEGYGNVTAGCVECDCGIGAADGQCNPVTGLCDCSPGAIGNRCDLCDLDHYGLSFDGCFGELPILYSFICIFYKNIES